MDLKFLDPSKGICLLSHGQGQNSASAMALLTDPARRDVYDTYVGDRNLVVLHADTNNEHEDTIAFRAWTAAYCAERGIFYKTIDGSMGYHGGAWAGGLTAQWDAHSTIGSVAFPSTCSDMLKVSPLYSFLADLMHQLYGFRAGRKTEYYAYLERFGEKMPVLIGFGRGEESRAGMAPAVDRDQMNFIDLIGLPPVPAKTSRLWMDRTISKRYPLIDIGFDRADSQHYLRSRGLPVPSPSLCEFCHWKGPAHIEAMRRFSPEKLDTWQAYEARKIAAWAERTAKSGAANSFVKGSISLTEFERKAHNEFGYMSDDDLRAFIFSHGHAMQTRH